MSKKTKQLYLLLIAQAGCLGMGLWMQHRFVTKAAVRTAQDQAWSHMERDASDLLSKAAQLRHGGPPGSAVELDELLSHLDAHRSSAGCLLIADSDWRVLHSVAGCESEGPPLKLGEHLAWRPVRDPSGRRSVIESGTLETPDGPHLAVAGPLPHLRAYLLIHRPLADIETATAALLESLPAISLMTLVWTCAFLIVAVYMVLGRFHEVAERGRKRSAADTLRQAQNLIRTRDAVIFGLAKLADSRDPETGDHLERISVYCTTLAVVLQRHPEFSDEVTPALVRLIGISSALHDIGKVGIEDRILLKRGSFTETERKRMQSHTTIGGDCLRKIEQRLGGSNFLQMAREIAVAHHEWWDGNGYPRGLSGEAIPLAARIVAIADVYDALSSKRTYKEAYDHSKCVDIIRSRAGRQFDPRLIDVWMTVEQKFREIARQYAPDSGAHAPPATGLIAVG